VAITGYRGGVVVGEVHLTLDPAATAEDFGRAFRHVDMVTITSAGGTDAGLDGVGAQLAFDNLVFASHHFMA
jgi:hypothetical protein